MMFNDDRRVMTHATVGKQKPPGPAAEGAEGILLPVAATSAALTAALLAIQDHVEALSKRKGWEVTRRGSLIVAYFRPRKLGSLVTLDVIDGRLWLHMSVSMPDRLPGWEQLKTIRDAVVGPEVEMIHFVPKSSEHVNIHDYCMHLWALLADRGAAMEYFADRARATAEGAAGGA